MGVMYEHELYLSEFVERDFVRLFCSLFATAVAFVLVGISWPPENSALGILGEGAPQTDG